MKEIGNMNTYEITAEINSILLDYVDPETGEISSDAAARLDELQGAFEAKIAAWCKFILNLQGEYDAIKKARQSMQERERGLDALIARHKKQVCDLCANRGIKKIFDPEIQISVAKTAPAVEVLDPKQIPAEYWLPADPVLNKIKLKADMKAGVEVPGAKLSAPGNSLRIK